MVVHSAQVYIQLKPLFSRHNGIGVQFTDEPTGALDQSTGQEVINILREINNQGKTVVLVTHDINIASNTNRIINICDGKIISDEMV